MAHPAGGEGIISKDSLVAYSNQFPAIDARLEKIQKRIESYLRSKGWKAFAIPPDTDKKDSRFVARLFPLFPHKTAATCSGLGWVGKNGLLVTREYGARLSWATVLTDAPFEVLEKPFAEGQCNKCNRCKAMCPAGAIKGKEWSRKNHGESLVDFEKCAAQLSTHHKILGKYVCGHCIVACPVGNQNEVKSWKGGDIGN
jgi:epoxyqueuosine reductase QueG